MSSKRVIIGVITNIACIGIGLAVGYLLGSKHCDDEIEVLKAIGEAKDRRNEVLKHELDGYSERIEVLARKNVYLQQRVDFIDAQAAKENGENRAEYEEIASKYTETPSVRRSEIVNEEKPEEVLRRLRTQKEVEEGFPKDFEDDGEEMEKIDEPDAYDRHGKRKIGIEIIDEERYFDECETYSKSEVVYYAGDKVLCDTDGSVMDVFSTVGPRAMDLISEKNQTIYARNHTYAIDYEITYDQRSYANEVVGLDLGD